MKEHNEVIEHLIQDKIKVTVCMKGSDKHIFYNGIIIGDDDYYITFSDEAVTGKIIYLAKRHILWIKRVVVFE